MSEEKVKKLNSLFSEFNGVSADDVLEATGKKTSDGFELTGFKVGKRPLPKQDLLQIASEAKLIKDTMLWQLILKRTQFIGQIKAYADSKNFEDVLFAKAMILSVQEIEKMVNAASSLKVG